MSQKTSRKTKVQKLLSFDDKQAKRITAIMTSAPSVNKHEHGRTISVKDLPDCEHKTRLLALVSNPAEASIVVIALKNSDGFWKAYAGYPDIRDLKPITRDFTYDVQWFCENIRDRSQVIMMGDKLPPEIIVKLFAEIKLEDCK